MAAVDTSVIPVQVPLSYVESVAFDGYGLVFRTVRILREDGLSFFPICNESDFQPGARVGFRASLMLIRRSEETCQDDGLTRPRLANPAAEGGSRQV